MTKRIDWKAAVPQGFAAMGRFDSYVRGSGLEYSLLELIKTRVSQINGCAYCLDMHTLDARAAGETEQRLHTLCAWRETPFFTPRERAALAWAEAVTLIADAEVTDALYEDMRAHFNEKEMVDVTLAVVVINGWNRLAISFHAEPGHYQPSGK